MGNSESATAMRTAAGRFLDRLDGTPLADTARRRFADTGGRRRSWRSRSSGRSSPTSATSVSPSPATSATAGPTTTGCTGPSLFVEYDNTQDDANHVHTVLRDPEGDFGEDLLRAHLHDHHRP